MSKNISRGPAPDGARALAAGRSRRRIGTVVGVLALHGAALWLLGLAIGPRLRPEPSRPGVVMVQVEPAPALRAPIAPPSIPRSPGPPRPAERPPVQATARAPAAPRAPREPREPRAPTVAATFAPRDANAPAAAAPADEAPPAAPVAPLRRTLRNETLRELATGERAWQDDPRLGTKPPPSVDTRLETGVAAAARGDCLRGEFKGNDMGLLNLPMLGLAALRGRCRPP